MPPANYSFLPWLRIGLANQITAQDHAPDVRLRAAVRVELEVAGVRVGGGTLTRTVARDVALFGPGDIIGIEARAVVRTEPRHWATDFEPNYLPQIEFYDEDFPWRYTPAAPDPVRRRLRPWIALVVLTEAEFRDGQAGGRRPLPYIEVTDPGVFPPPAQLWAWAHVHVNESLAAGAEITSGDMNAVLPRFEAVLARDPDLAYSRLICPRKLAPNTAYHAFVVPVFETGRLAGLGLDPASSPSASFSAWAPYPMGPPAKAEGQNIPYYYRWFFLTGEGGDFETLVRRLEPKPVDARVGTRDLDVLDPGSNLPPIDDPGLRGVLKLGGALRVPRERFSAAELAEVELYENWPALDGRGFRQKLARLINLADDYASRTAAAANAASGLGAAVAGDPDPLITPPLYGTWHALTRRLLFRPDGTPAPDPDNWVHDLNLDPRHRVAAGLGTRVVQERQEALMDDAWGQLGQVLEANRRIRLAQLAKAVSASWYQHHVLPLHQQDPERALMVTAPVLKRVLAEGSTVHHRLGGSRVPPVLVSTALRRTLRPRGRLMRALPFQDAIRPGNLLERVNNGRVTAAPPKGTPAGVTTVDRLLDEVKRQAGPSGAGADLTREDRQVPAVVDQLPRSPGFVLTEPRVGVRLEPGATDSQEATRFKESLRDAYAVIQAGRDAGAVPPRTGADLGGLTQAVLQAVDPDHVIPRRTWQSVRLPGRVRDELGEAFVEAMAYPEFDTPMYKPLAEISAELFLPNINRIAANSITLLETNQEFIEAYMVGLNHEFARELLWREYPTDQRGSYFRQFWDVTGFFTRRPPDAAQKERLRDIPPLHRWSRTSSLGDHDHRALLGGKEQEVVLVIRGELLKRYPTAVIYAHHARWAPGPGGVGIDTSQMRSLEPLTATEEDDPPRAKVRTPLYEAKVEPDIYFFGFDLTTAMARGGTGANPTDDPGWFFVIKERPGEPRFGLDSERPPQRRVWNDLSWPDVQPGPAGSYITITEATPTLTLDAPAPTPPDPAAQQRVEDAQVAWNKDMSSADLAYILYQAPVLVAVHAAELLRTL